MFACLASGALQSQNRKRKKRRRDLCRLGWGCCWRRSRMASRNLWGGITVVENWRQGDDWTVYAPCEKRGGGVEPPSAVNAGLTSWGGYIIPITRGNMPSRSRGRGRGIMRLVLFQNIHSSKWAIIMCHIASVTVVHLCMVAYITRNTVIAVKLNLTWKKYTSYIEQYHQTNNYFFLSN